MFSSKSGGNGDAAGSDGGYDELPPIKIETSWDHNALKRQLDETAARTVVECGYPEEYFWADVKLVLMFAACVVAVVAQFFPGEFPKNYHVLLVCVYLYMALSVLLQVVFSVVDRDFIIFTKHREPSAEACTDHRCPSYAARQQAAWDAAHGDKKRAKAAAAATKRAMAKCQNRGNGNDGGGKDGKDGAGGAAARSLLFRYGLEVRSAMEMGKLEFTLELALRHAPCAEDRCATSHTTRANLFFDEAGYFDEDLFCKEVEIALGKFEEAVARRDAALAKKDQ